jgi:hypothetical protein
LIEDARTFIHMQVENDWPPNKSVSRTRKRKGKRNWKWKKKRERRSRTRGREVCQKAECNSAA